MAKNKIRVQTDNLTFCYPTGEDKNALEEINLCINEGEFVGVIGPSGAGKTTLCLALRGLIPYSQPGVFSGTVLIDGVSTLEIPSAVLARTVGIVFQDPESQIVGMTVEEDVAFALQNFGLSRLEIRKRISRALDIVGLQGFEKRDTIALSGGQKQRLAIAGTLATEASILILDEPTSELDPDGKAEVFEVLRNLRQEGRVTTIVVEHELDELAESCSQLIVMNSGRIVKSGEPGEIFRDVQLLTEIMGSRIPTVCWVTNQLISQGLMEDHQFSWREQQTITELRRLLINHGVNTNV